MMICLITIDADCDFLDGKGIGNDASNFNDLNKEIFLSSHRKRDRTQKRSFLFDAPFFFFVSKTFPIINEHHFQRQENVGGEKKRRRKVEYRKQKKGEMEAEINSTESFKMPEAK